MIDYCKRFVVLAACLGMLGLSGCLGGDGNVGAVTGTVTIDGELIDHALVTFMPAQGRASAGWTDEKGVYILAYVMNQNGALIGEHSVTITTKVVPETNYGAKTYDEGGLIKPGKKSNKRVQDTGRKEMLPKKYCDRNETELTATVKKGSNTIDFDLTTD